MKTPCATCSASRGPRPPTGCPRTGEAYRFNKSGEALDVSYLTMARWMDAAIAYVRFSGAPPGGYLVCDEVRFTPLPGPAK
jgi:hypothetical protein